MGGSWDPGWASVTREAVEIWLNEVRDEDRIQAELARIDEKWRSGDLTPLGYEVARSKLRFGKDR